MSLFLEAGWRVVFCQYFTLYICHNSPWEGSIKGNFASVMNMQNFYTFPKNQYIHHFLLLKFQHQGLQSSARSPHLTSTLELAELNKYSNNKWLGPALLVRSEIFENQKNNTESRETYIQTKNTETITEAPLIAVPKGRRVERSNILQYDFYVCLVKIYDTT